MCVDFQTITGIAGYRGRHGLFKYDINPTNDISSIPDPKCIRQPRPECTTVCTAMSQKASRRLSVHLSKSHAVHPNKEYVLDTDIQEQPRGSHEKNMP